MLKELGIYLALLACMAAGEAAVLRKEQPTTVVTTLEETTGKAEEAAMDSTTIAPKFHRVPLSRDEQASIQIGLATVEPSKPDSAPTQHTSNIGNHNSPQQKSAKLLLLSTPPKRFIEVEQQVEEQDEADDNVRGGTMATATSEATTMGSVDSEETTISSTTEPETTEMGDIKTTKLFAINATSLPDTPAPTVAVALAKDNTTIAIAEQPQDARGNNVAVAVTLVEDEPEAEYVLLNGADVLVDEEGHEVHLGSFTHIGSDEHLQPVVHSIEIVPTSFDDPLLVDYVHALV
ncbi:uncharacterized protein LOC115624922 [Scaptodrosophila lebanonensis]|uniref:Uncharacterized protein LOC115624922 n=1 Tax=Drosophila lebanonensis TaxID=7225 RepID=A0A6J2TKT6_DROLE|nr:uncharacterized protein LOC115624922 [Scaptodrosophila lebanonensis]